VTHDDKGVVTVYPKDSEAWTCSNIV
jgi:hypothetical protein